MKQFHPDNVTIYQDTTQQQQGQWTRLHFRWLADVSTIERIAENLASIINAPQSLDSEGGKSTQDNNPLLLQIASSQRKERREHLYVFRTGGISKA
jgi:hypothetical protein